MQPRAVVIGSLAMLLLTDPGATAQTPSESRYIQILERYQKGDDDVVPILASLDDKAIEAGEHAVVKAFEEAPIPSSRGARLLRTAIVAHTDAAIRGRSASTPIPWSPHLSTAQRYVERLAAKTRDDPVALQWWLTAIGAMHAQRNYAQAMTTARRARQVCGERPEFVFAIGVTNELAWVWEHEENFHSPFSGSLDDAEKNYAQVLALDPALIEARIRLGRVRTLRGDTQSAARTLAAVPDSAGPALVYLARLFEGDALERQGSLAEARKRYDAAVRLRPQGQSALLALAYSEYQDGARPEAVGHVRETAANRVAADDSDPWFWYSLGLAWVANPAFAALRAEVRK
jgi:tetratricopeptide (TPR) repeat protein